MSNGHKLIAVVGSIIAVLLVVLIVVVLLVARQGQLDAKKAACEKYPTGSVEYFYCIDLADN